MGQIPELRCPKCGAKSRKRYTRGVDTIRECTNVKCAHVFERKTYRYLLSKELGAKHEETPHGTSQS